MHYIAYELALLEDITLRRKLNKLTEKKKDLEYAIAKRLNKIFKQFIYRFQNDVEVYFQYIKFCKSVDFGYAISAIIGQMLQVNIHFSVLDANVVRMTNYVTEKADDLQNHTELVAFMAPSSEAICIRFLAFMLSSKYVCKPMFSVA